MAGCQFRSVNLAFVHAMFKMAKIDLICCLMLTWMEEITKNQSGAFTGKYIFVDSFSPLSIISQKTSFFSRYNVLLQSEEYQMQCTNCQ